MKLDKSIKKKIVNFYKKGMIKSQISLKFGLSESTVTNVIEKYNAFGKTSFEPRKNSTHKSPEFKHLIVLRVLNGETIQDISIQEKISYCAIRSWVMKYQELGYNGLMKKSRIKKILRRELLTNNEKYKNIDSEQRCKIYEEQIRILWMENDILKKSIALAEKVKAKKKSINTDLKS